MGAGTEPTPRRGPNRLRRRLLQLGAILTALLLLGVGGWFVLQPDAVERTTFAVRRGPLDIKVLEGGNVEALESQEIKSEVKGWQGTKILWIIEEGYYVTEEDVENRIKLVELDSSEIQEKLTTAEIEFKGTQASLTEAMQGYDIQLNQSETDIYVAELELKFARMEMEKYLGAEVAAIVAEEIEKVERDATLALPPVPEVTATSSEKELEETLLRDGNGESASEQHAPQAEPELPSASENGETGQEDSGAFEISLSALRRGHPKIDFSQFADAELLGDGEAGQKLRSLENERLVAQTDLGLAETELDSKSKLFAKEFITLKEFENEKTKVQKQKIGLEAAETAKSLFLEYEFPKEAEKRMSDYIQAKRKLERTEKAALSELAKASAKLSSARARYKIEESRLKEYRDQIKVATMYAERPGLVVYGGKGVRYWDSEPIKEGATIRERQAIITIPDMSSMAVIVKIHESDIKKIKVKQKARIRVDAQSENILDGEVIKVSVLPDSENRYMNPGLKVYETTVKIHGIHEWLKPGMSAEVEILVNHLDDALYIPLQSVVPQGDDLVCFVVEDGQLVPRKVTTGESTIEFITITSGLEEGEDVMIRPPDGSRQDEETGPGKSDIETSEVPEPAASPAEGV